MPGKVHKEKAQPQRLSGRGSFRKRRPRIAPAAPQLTLFYLKRLPPLLGLICRFRTGGVTSEAVILAAFGAIGVVIWYSMLQVLPAKGGADCGFGEAWPVPVR
jgi:hypothetical protein